jgi:hypothetical protein
MRTAYRAGVVMGLVLALCGTGVRADQATPCAGTNVGANIEASPELADVQGPMRSNCRGSAPSRADSDRAADA